jgi:uncharacterized Zn-binding protein involved in type VI secretion
MAGLILHAGATVTCSHAGTATPTATNPKVTLSGQAVATVGPYNVAGCTLPPPPNGNGPCVTGQFTTASTKVTSNGQPVLVTPAPSTCVPTGTPLVVTATQSKVSAL